MTPYERHVTSMTHRIASLRAVHVTALPYFTRLPVSCLSQQTREQPRAVTEFSVLLGVFYHFRFSLGFGNFPKFLVQPSRPRLPARVGPFTSSVCKSTSYFLSRCSGFSSSQSSEPPLSFGEVIPPVLLFRTPSISHRCSSWTNCT